jgi:hypothetical protein
MNASLDIVCNESRLLERLFDETRKTMKRREIERINDSNDASVFVEGGVRDLGCCGHPRRGEASRC